MADIDLGSIGGTLYLVDKSFSSTLGAANSAMDKVGGAVDKFKSKLQQMRDDIDHAAAIQTKLHGASDLTAQRLTMVSNALGVMGAAAGPIGIALQGVAVAVMATGAAAVAAGGAITAAAVYTANLGDELLTMSKQSNVSVESLSKWRYVADQTGVSLSTISGSVSKFTADLGTGAKRFEDAVAKIGLNIRELRNAAPEDAFQKVIDSLGKVPNAADRAAVGTAIFGTRFKQLSALIDENVAEMDKDFRAFGGVVTTEMAVAGDAFNDAKARLGSMVEAVTLQVGALFVPAFAAAMKEIGDAWVRARERISGNSEKLVQTIDAVGDFVIKWAGILIAGVGQVTMALADFFAGKFITDFRIVEDLAKVGQVISKLIEAQGILTHNDAMASVGRGLNSVMTELKHLGEAGPANIDNIRDAFKQAGVVVTAFGVELATHANGAVKRMRDSIAATAEEVRKTNGAFEGLGEKANQEALRSAMAWNKFIEGIRTNFAKQWAAIVKQMDAGAKAIAETFREEVRLNEEADRTMRRLNENQAQFEIGELQRRLDKQKAYYAVLQSLGADTSRLLIAAERATGAEMLQTAVKTREFQEALNSVFVLMGPTTGAFVEGTRALSGFAEGFDDTEEKAREFLGAIVDIVNDAGRAMAEAFSSGGSLSDAFLAGVESLSRNLTGTFTSMIGKGVRDGSISGFTAFAGTAATLGLSIAAQYAINFWKEMKDAPRAREAGAAAASQYIAGFGGAMDFRRMGELAGVDPLDIAKVFGPSSPEMFERAVNRIQPALDAFKQKMEGLGEAAQGVNTMLKGFDAQLTNWAAKQVDAMKAAHQAMLDAMKAAGMSADDIAKKKEELDKKLTETTFTATDDQVAAYNQMGLIIGGVIANTINATGDVVGAVLAVGDALERMRGIAEQFHIGTDQMSAATQQVMALYATIKDNEDVFTSISGLGQVMHGLGNALVANQQLANAFGQQLAADFKTLTDRGVDANLALATMAPQLQQLWELSKSGKLILDETTKALLEQAEAAGVVGEAQRSVNDKILDVLTQIRDLIGELGDHAIPRMAQSMEQGGRAVGRALNDVANAGRTARDAVREVQDGLSGIKQPAPIKIDVDFDVEDIDWGRYAPPDWGKPRVEGFARGSGGFRQFYDGTPAMLHGLERVQTYGDYMAERAQDGVSGGVVVELDGEVLVAHNARNAKKWARIRTGRSERTFT